MIFAYDRQTVVDAKPNGWISYRFQTEGTQFIHLLLLFIVTLLRQVTFRYKLQTDKGPGPSSKPDHEKQHLHALGDSTVITTRQVPLACRIPHCTAWSVIQNQFSCPYRVQCVQISPSDQSPQEKFCRCFVAQTADMLFASSHQRATIGINGMTHLQN